MRVVKQGNSYYILIPSKVVNEHGVKEGMEARLGYAYKTGNKLILIYEITLE